jgi:hypothetical protein
MAHRPGSCCIAVLDGQALDFIKKTVQRSQKRRALSVLSTHHAWKRVYVVLCERRGCVIRRGRNVTCHHARRIAKTCQRWPGCPISLERHGLSGRETG